MGALVNMTKQGATVGFAVVRTTLPEKRPSVVRHSWAWAIASHAVASLIDEVRLTPKPGLVDARGSGSHNDVSLEMFERSAEVLRPYFALMALAGAAHPMGVLLREKLGAIGRCAEKAMLVVTDGVNTHRGAIWTLGLLCAAAASPKRSAKELCARAGQLASLPDRFSSERQTHGQLLERLYGVRGVRGEAQDGFPHVWRDGLSMLQERRRLGIPGQSARLDALLAIMSKLEDTCLLHRGGTAALEAARSGASTVLGRGGSESAEGVKALRELDSKLLELWVSPGGSADLLAATLFVDRLLLGGVHA